MASCSIGGLSMRFGISLAVAGLSFMMACESDNYKEQSSDSDIIVDSAVLVTTYCEKLRGCLAEINCDPVLTPSQEACEEDFGDELSTSEIENYNRAIDAECASLTGQLCEQSGHYFEAICECPNEQEPPPCADDLFCINPRGQFPGNGGVCLEADGDADEDARTCENDTDCRCADGDTNCTPFDICMKPIFRQINMDGGIDGGTSIDDTTFDDGTGWCASYCIDAATVTEQ